MAFGFIALSPPCGVKLILVLCTIIAVRHWYHSGKGGILALLVEENRNIFVPYKNK